MPALADGRARGHLPRGMTDLAGIAARRGLRPRLLRLHGGNGERLGAVDAVAGRADAVPLRVGSRRHRFRWSGRGASPRRPPAPRGSPRRAPPARPPSAPGTSCAASPAPERAAVGRVGRVPAVRVVAAAAADAPAPLRRRRGRPPGESARQPRRRRPPPPSGGRRRNNPRDRRRRDRPRRAPPASSRPPSASCTLWQGPHVVPRVFARSCRVSATTASRGVAPDAQVSPAARVALAQKAAARPGAMDIVAGGAGDHPLAIAPPVAPEQRQPGRPPAGGRRDPERVVRHPAEGSAGRAGPVAGGAEPLDRGAALAGLAERDPPPVLPVTAAAQAADGGGALGGPRRAGRAVRCRRDRGFARVTEQAGVGFAREHQPRGRRASPVGAVTGRAGEFPAGARRPAGLDERLRRRAPAAASPRSGAPRGRRSRGRASSAPGGSRGTGPPGSSPAAACRSDRAWERWQERQVIRPPGAKKAPALTSRAPEARSSPAALTSRG